MDHDHIYKSESLRVWHHMSTAGAQLLVDLRVGRSQQLITEQAEVSVRPALAYHFLNIYNYALLLAYDVCTSMPTSTIETTA